MNERNISLPKSNLINFNNTSSKENKTKNYFSHNKSTNYLNKSTLTETNKKDSIQMNYLPQLNNKNIYETVQTNSNNNNSLKTFSEKFKPSNTSRLNNRFSNKTDIALKIKVQNNNKNYINFRQRLRKSLINKPKKVSTEFDNYFNENKKSEYTSSLKSYDKIKFNKNEIDNDYTLMIKKLDNWDKAHCFKNKDDLFSLYNTLSEYYKKNNLVEDMNNLNYMDNLLKEKINYYRYKENKTFDIWGSKQNNNIIKSNDLDIIEQSKGSMLNSSIINNIKRDYNKNKIDLNNKILREKIKYENQLHRELIFVNNILIKKKCFKKEKSKEMNKLFIEIDKSKHEYNQKSSEYKKMYYFRMEQYTLQYDSLISEKLEEIKQINEEMKDPKESNTNTRKLEKKSAKLVLLNEIKDLEFMHKNKISIINAEMKRDLDKIKKIYKKKFEEMNKKKEKLEYEVKILNDELNYYKTINEELLREHELYYLDILRNGNDCRKEGLVWAVKNLLELQVNLEYHHFPKYLTHEQIDYLKKLALLSLEESELKLILKILKKRQKNNRENENSEYMNLFDTISKDKMIQDKNETISKEIERKELKTYEEELLLIKKKIDKKFFKVYKDNEEILKQYFGKNLEDQKLQNFLYFIKKALYSDNNNSFLNQNKVSIIDVFMGKTKNKDLFELIINITKRLEEIDTKKKSMMKKEKDNYIEKFKNSGINLTNNYFYNKELIKNCLFGNKIEF